MSIPVRRSVMHFAVAGACCWMASTGYAQQQAEPAAPVATPLEEQAAKKPEVVTVSGSRLASRGFHRPTPTTTLSAADLERNAEPKVFNTLVEFPAPQRSTGRTTGAFSTSSGTQGLSPLSLRGLSPIRTLTLLDGQRVVGGSLSGVTGVGQFPQSLIKRVDVVTGGASASYGSDAVDGVANFVADKRFQGFRANVEAGQTTYGDDEHGTVQTAFGKACMTSACTWPAAPNMAARRACPIPASAARRPAGVIGT